MFEEIGTEDQCGYSEPQFRSDLMTGHVFHGFGITKHCSGIINILCINLRTILLAVPLYPCRWLKKLMLYVFMKKKKKKGGGVLVKMR